MAHELDDLIRLTPEEVYGPDMAEMFNSEETGWNVGFPSDYVVVGTNPEMADMSNPHGEIVRERWFIVAEDAKGNRRTWGGPYDSPEDADAAYRLEAPPIDLWAEIQPCYGSEAYVDGGWEQDLCDLEREDEMGGYFIVTMFA